MICGSCITELTISICLPLPRHELILRTCSVLVGTLKVGLGLYVSVILEESGSVF